MDYKIRVIRKNEYPILSEFLYEAIFIPESMDKPLKSIIEQPELQLWVRIMNDYGHIDDETPSFAISLYEEYRNLSFEVVNENGEEYIMVCGL